MGPPIRRPIVTNTDPNFKPLIVQPEKPIEGKKKGAPTSYTTELAQKIIDRIYEGHSVLQIGKLDGYPTRETIYQWIAKHPNFADTYYKATPYRAETLLNRLENTMEQPAPEHECTPSDPNGLAYRKFVADNLRWMIPRLNPRKYGDKVEQTHTGEVKVQKIERTIVDINQPPKTDK